MPIDLSNTVLRKGAFSPALLLGAPAEKTSDSLISKENLEKNSPKPNLQPIGLIEEKDSAGIAAPLPKGDASLEDFLRNLYEAVPAYAPKVLKGTLKEGEAFTAEEQKEVDVFNGQFTLVVEDVRARCETWGIDPLLLLDLDKFSVDFKSRKFYADQSNAFYGGIKRLFEMIAFALSNNVSLNDREKKRILIELFEQITFCGPGVFSNTEMAATNLMSHDGVNVWLARFRKTIITQIASNHCRDNNISEGNEIHVLNSLLIYARDEEWNAYGFETLSALNEFHAGLANITPDQFVLYHSEFFKLYTPTTIMMELATILRVRVIERLKKKLLENEGVKGHVYLETKKDVDNVFSGLPFVNENMLAVFNIDEKNYSAQESKASFDFFQFGGSRLQLKSTHELMCSLTQFLIDKEKECNQDQLFFQFHSGNEEKEEKNKYTLVPESPELCYSYSSGDIIPYLDKPIPIDLTILNKFNIPISKAQFDFYYEKGIRNFSGCGLDGVDLSIYNHEKLKLTGARLSHAKVTPIQFMDLFEQLISVSPSSFSAQDLFKQLPSEEFASKSPKEKGLLLFYAVSLNAPHLISALLINGADVSVLNRHKKIPIDVAASAGFWGCVEAFDRPRNIFEPIYSRVLLDAAKANQWGAVRALVSAGVPTNGVLAGMTVLHFAASCGNVEIVRLLLKKGANPAAVNSDNKTPIQLASMACHWNCVSAFADTRQKEDKGEFRYGSALLDAARAMQWEVASALLNVRADTSCFDSSTRNTALHFAALDANTGMIRALLEAGAATNAANLANLTPIQFLLTDKISYLESIKAFTTHTDFHGFSNYGEALILASKENQWEAASALVKAGARTGCIHEPTGMTALHFAAESGNAAMVTMLLKVGANAGALTHANAAVLNGGSKTPIQLASMGDHWECVEAFAGKCDDNIHGDFRYGLVLLRAAEIGQWKAARALVKAKANTSCVDVLKKMTALHFAAQNGDAETVRELLNAGANAFALNSDGLAPIQLASREKHWGCVKVFAESQSSTPSKSYYYGAALLDAVRAKEWEAAGALLQAGASTSFWFDKSTGRSALHFAAKNGNAEMVEMLVDKGANMSALDNGNKTPIEIAFLAGYWDCVNAFPRRNVETLISKNINYKGELITPLHVAVRIGNPKMVGDLLEMGVDPSVLDSQGYTAIQRANSMYGSNSECVIKLAVKGIDAKLDDDKLRDLTGNRKKIMEQILAYQTEAPKRRWLSNSEPWSVRRKEDIANLFAILIKNSTEQEMLREIKDYCRYHITTGFFGRSALRSRVMSVVTSLKVEQIEIEIKRDKADFDEKALKNLNGNIGKIKDEILAYRAQASKSSWLSTSEPLSVRRKKDVAELFSILLKNPSEQEVLKKIEGYCRNHITTGFFGRSALRSRVMSVVTPLRAAAARRP